MGIDWQRDTGKSETFISVDSCGLRLTAVKCYVPALPMPWHHDRGGC